jgi:hypothetical protein
LGQEDPDADAGFSFAEPFPEKTPGMHWRIYLRMRLAAGESIVH